MKLNKVVDTNYLLNKAVFALSKMKELDKLKVSLTYTIRNLVKDGDYDNFVLASDYKSSWRKIIYPEYKMQRKEKRDKDELNWEMIYQLYEEFKEEIVNECNVKILQSDRMEGDDVIASFVRKGNLKGYSNVIIASDRDLLQLLEYQYSPDYINVQVNEERMNKKIYLPFGAEDFLDEMRMKTNRSMFFMSQNDSNYIEYFDKHMAIRENIEVHGESKIFTKVIAGDRKDNVKSTHYKHNLEKGTSRGIGDKTAEKIYIKYKELYPEPINFKSKEFILRAKNLIAENRKIKEEETLETVKDNLILNTKLIMLDESFIPKDLRQGLNEKIDLII